MFIAAPPCFHKSTLKQTCGPIYAQDMINHKADVRGWECICSSSADLKHPSIKLKSKKKKKRLVTGCLKVLQEDKPLFNSIRQITHFLFSLRLLSLFTTTV